ncbi:Di-copper centre-containing protein [Mytilinidion resinicola]|uniref:tyrosinase n=1 Tax=Mytilinidion resinicola TaxID=574789 RepID=A0A6A6Z455_9PEZI|nr:Di-copper centre-containing protein [Mytilinidion resinicola]KAF2815433.1 Di-copper centre-containing protein [Mytilinidion resinicola]
MLVAFFFFLNAAVASHDHLHHKRDHVVAARLSAIEEKADLLKRANYIATTGIKGTLSPRLEIRNLKKNADQWALYILGMAKFQAMSQSDPLSYYQIAGIHGRPFVTWNQLPEVNAAGMCPHVSTLFWPWHRPYLAMFEQALFTQVQAVVNTAPASTKSRWQNAANTLRIPYWDWAAVPPSGEGDVPTAIRDQTVTVTGPTGTQTLKNPLYQYTFHPPSNDLGGSPFNTWTTTIRRPYRDNDQQAWRSNNGEFDSVMNSNRVSLRDRVYNLFINNANFAQVSTEATGTNTGNPNSHDSFESTHDSIHVISGGDTGPAGGGDMYYLDLSAFDPVFWLHHANVDRQFAMWQVINPNTYVGNGIITQNNWQWNSGEMKNSYTPLKPFTKDTKGTYFTSMDIRKTTALNYYYPETNSGATASSVKSAVNTLYGPNSKSTFKRDVAGRSLPYEGRPVRQGDHEYLLTINCHKFAFDGSYTILAFLGNVSDANPQAWYTAPNLIGINGVLAMKGMGNSTVPIEGCIPLTTTLQGKVATGELEDLTPYKVSHYLKQHLTWRVLRYGNVVVPADEVPGLHLAVSTCPVEPAKAADEFPTWVGTMQIMANVTAGKPAGNPWTPPANPYGTPSSPSGAPSAPYPTSSNVPWNPSVPEDEPGYCVSHQTIEYVDQDGNFLYSEKS